MVSRRLDLTGQVFGRLTVLEDVGRACDRSVVWRCRCSCTGALVNVSANSLRTGNTSSCGCLQRERTGAINVIHGLARQGRRHALYNTWCGLKARCDNPKDKSFENYGGRGITICARWRSSFPAFLADMGERPPRMTIDRRDNGGHYSCGQCDECQANGWPMNCRWATASEQARNRRSPRCL